MPLQGAGGWNSGVALSGRAGHSSDSEDGAPQSTGRFMAGRSRCPRQPRGSGPSCGPFMTAQAAVLSDGCVMSDDGCGGAPVLHSIADRRRRHSGSGSRSPMAEPAGPTGWVWTLALQTSML
jgi:hypothetical protein